MTTPKQILDSFSETLMQDERILSEQERALLASLLQHAGTSAVGSLSTQEAVRTVVASAVGETVAQRAFAVLGGSIVEHILQGSHGSASDTNVLSATDLEVKAHKQPGPPGVKAPPKEAPKQPQPPRSPMRGPSPPVPGPQPGPPGIGLATVTSGTGVTVLDEPLALPAKCVVLEQFLAPQELQQLISYTLEREGEFGESEVISPQAGNGLVDYEHRRSSVLMDTGPWERLMRERINAVRAQVFEKLGMEEFSISAIEAQITASNDGDFFRFHSDNGSERLASRYLTFVYFFHREPRQFEGGELRIHDARLEKGVYVSQGSYQTIVPQQNQIVFFPCELMHEITPVRCPSRLFADGRFTVNGWLRR